ncbi:MAG: Ig-like domain-containing protein [Planctomycetes bacterium]|nr:Ig-like domain-containing protein [Planctomycetota bacterium]
MPSLNTVAVTIVTGPRGYLAGWKRLVLGAVAVLLGTMAVASAATTGPGIPKLTFATGDEYSRELARIRAPDGYAHGRASMIDGYLFVPFFRDQSPGGGGIDIYDLGNPIDPDLASPLVPITRKLDSTTATIREPHGYGSTLLNGQRLVVLQATNGIDIWDFSNVRAPTRIRNFALPGISQPVDYGGIWWVHVQAPYVYAGGNSSGLYIIDISSPSNPVLVKNIPNSQLGGFSVAATHAIGNQLVLASNAQSSASANTLGGRYAFLDIGDPVNPQVIRLYTEANVWPNGYASLVNGGKLLIGGVNSTFQVLNIADPANIGTTAPLSGPGPGGYVNVQDGFAHSGFQFRIIKVDVRGANPVLARSGTTNNSDKDDNFAIPLGNLVFAANDHLSYSSLMVQNAAPDNTAPAVNMVIPRNGASGQPLSTRIGLTFTDELIDSTLSTATVIVRRQGTTTPIAGRYSYQTNIVNFTPSSPLQAGTTYDVVVPAGGVQDVSGNAASSTFTSTFTTGGVVVQPVAVTMTRPTARTVGSSVGFSVASSSGAAPLQYAWSFGDGSSSGFSTTASVSHTYASANHFSVTVTVRDATGATATSSATQLIYNPPTATKPAASGAMALNAAGNRLYVVNPDSDTVAVIDTRSLQRVAEISVGRNPRSLAQGPNNTIWVASQDSGTVSVIDANANAVAQTIAMPYGSQPFGVAIPPDLGAVYVSLHATGRLAKIDPASRQIVAQVDVGPKPRALAVSADSQRILVTRFISGDDRGEIREVAASSMSVVRTFGLPLDTSTVDNERQARGLPNYLAAVSIAPDGRSAWVASKKDNILRGVRRDGQQLTFESSVRTLVSQLDLIGNGLGPVLDLNDRDQASAVAFSPLGDLAFVATQGTNTVEVIDTYDLNRTVVVINVGLAPQGLMVSADGNRLFVQHFMGRSVGVWDISAVTGFTSNVVNQIQTIGTVGAEKLTPAVLAGKRVFYNANDRRMNRDGYISCASCHADGGSDGRVWDFSGRGEGLRRTTNLQGRSGVGHGPVHWTGNFDEIHDFEHDARAGFGGTGFLSDGDFNARNTTLGASKAGISTQLDELAAYVSSLSTVKASPHRNGDGSLTGAAAAGKQVFANLNCASCHSGPRMTDSALNVLHNVGTLKPSSGSRLGQTLTGLDTPTLKGAWTNDSFLHDGSAASLLDVITTANAGGAHGATASLSAGDRANLVAYLQQIDDSETPAYRQAVDGAVVIEAESFVAKRAPAGHSWIPIGTPGGFVGSGAIQALPNSNSANVDSAIDASSPRADYLVDFARTGLHHVWIRGMGASTADNSVHVGLDGAPASTSAGITLATGAFAWSKNTTSGTVATISVPSVGRHLVQVWMREDGVVVDRLLLTPDAGLIPSGNGPAESSTGAGSGPGPINNPPAVAMTAPANGAVFTAGQTVTLSASAGDTDGSVASVRFLVSGSVVGTDSNGGDGWSVTWTAVSGSHALTATATDNQGATTTANAVAITVNGAPAGDAFQQDAGGDGLVAVDLEHALVTRGGAAGFAWTTVTAPAGYTGASALQATPNNGTTIATGYASGSPRLDVPITFTRTGVHVVWIRGQGATAADNSVHVGLDGSPNTTADHGTIPPGSAYVWTNATTDGPAMTVDVPSVGRHIVNVWMREDGVVVDRLLLTVNAAYVPSGVGPPASPTGNAPSTPGSYTQDGGADGIVLIAAENHAANAASGGQSWNLVTAPAAYGGSGAMQALPNNGAMADTGYQTTCPRLDYRITFVRTGVHHVWVRGLGATVADNSIHVGLDGATVASADRMTLSTSGYAWTKATSDGVVASIDVATTGTHTLNVWMREDGVVVDALLLTTNPGYVPPASSTGPVEAAPPMPTGVSKIGPAQRGGLTAAVALVLGVVLVGWRLRG